MRDRGEPTVSFTMPAEGACIDILVENNGRNSFGPRISESKGLESVLIDTLVVTNWECIPISPEEILSLKSKKTAACGGAAVFCGTFKAKPGIDAYLSTEALHKGYVFINGFMLGRYWENCSQKTLYVPGGLLQEENTVTVLELYPEGETASIEFAEKHELCGTPIVR